MDFIFVAAGAFVGMRVCATMLISGTLCWAVSSQFSRRKASSKARLHRIVQWTLWFGASCMVAAGLMSFALSWRTALSAFQISDKCSPFRSAPATEHARIEAPMSGLPPARSVVSCCACLARHASFGIASWETCLSRWLLSFWLALVAARVTGETDTTPVGAMGKVTQLIFGGLSPGNVTVNLMSANITAGAATSSADLLTDLKSGYLLGANPRQQFLAQSPASSWVRLSLCSRSQSWCRTRRCSAPTVSRLPPPRTWAAVARALGRVCPRSSPSSCG